MGTGFGSQAARRPLGPTATPVISEHWPVRARALGSLRSHAQREPPGVCAVWQGHLCVTGMSHRCAGTGGPILACVRLLLTCLGWSPPLLATQVLRSAGHRQRGHPSQHCLVSGQDASLRAGLGAAGAAGRGGSPGGLGRRGSAVSGICQLCRQRWHPRETAASGQLSCYSVHL